MVAAYLCAEIGCEQVIISVIAQIKGRGTITNMETLDSGAVTAALVAMGMSAAFIVADPRSTNTRYLAVFLVSIGISILFNVAFVRPYPPMALPFASHFAPMFTAIAMVAGSEWILRIRRMVPAGHLRTRFGDMQFRVAQVAAVVYMIVGMTFNEWRAEYFVGVYDDWVLITDHHFWLFAAPFAVSVLCVIDGTLMTLNRKPDRPEAVRLLGIAIASPLIASGLLLPSPWASYASVLGQMIFLVAAVQYHVLQGQRGQFLKRFLSPGVAELVRRNGLKAAMQQQTMDITAVSCDLRNYTAFAEHRDPEESIAVLRHFYDVVGSAAREYGATIKDYAGDGVLLLIGAPLPVEDHAQKSVAMARAVIDSMADYFSEHELPLGVGFGIASGPVRVGVIGEERLEYVAVGKAVNLSARLCQHAASGEILADEITHAAIEAEHNFVQSEPVSFKGFSDQLQPWAWSASAA